ncbi:uncharacterized protein L201_005766 [Kwoniella dendrophila CBS 6074]|uniref:Nicotinamide N-methyltransferase n=1 Tax=Kwoniella dendrophila CBS 6074 TaxID=1295534 RepID=A0AAX4K0Y3_9TREE
MDKRDTDVQSKTNQDIVDEDSTDIFDTSLFSLFSIPPIGFESDSNGYFTYYPPSSSSTPNPNSNGRIPKHIKLKIPKPPSSLYTTLQAQLIWPSSIFLADLISKGDIDVSNKNVIELGSSAGLPSIVTYLKNCKEIVSTDYDVQEVVDILNENFNSVTQQIESQGDQDVMTNFSNSKRWTVLGHCWGEDVKPLLEAISPYSTEEFSNIDTEISKEEKPKFDIILAADVIWTTSTHEILLDSIQSLINPENGIVHITVGLHTGRGPLKRFIESAKQRNFKIDIKGEFRLNGWDKYNENMSNPGEEERGVVVWFTMKL